MPRSSSSVGNAGAPRLVHRGRPAGEHQRLRRALADLLDRSVSPAGARRRRRTRGSAARSAASTGRRSRGPAPPRGRSRAGALDGSSRPSRCRDAPGRGRRRRDRGRVSHRYGYPGRDRGPPVGAHADGLLVLELLALGLQRRRDHHLGPLEGADVLVSAGRHRGLERTHQVEGAVVLLGRAEQDLLQRPVLAVVETRVPRGSDGWKVAMPQW